MQHSPSACQFGLHKQYQVAQWCFRVLIWSKFWLPSKFFGNRFDVQMATFFWSPLFVLSHCPLRIQQPHKHLLQGILTQYILVPPMNCVLINRVQIPILCIIYILYSIEKGELYCKRIPETYVPVLFLVEEVVCLLMYSISCQVPLKHCFLFPLDLRTSRTMTLKM